MKKLRYVFYLVLGFFFFLGACKVETKYELKPKVVLSKTTVKEDFKIAFTDGSDCNVSYGLYELAEKGDTMVFKCVDGLSFNIWNCGFAEVVKQKY
jgi:hypothetical protein